MAGSASAPAADKHDTRSLSFTAPAKGPPPPAGVCSSRRRPLWANVPSARIDASALDGRLAAVEVRVLADVTNPLTGPGGASAVYGPQKGADAVAVAELDRALAHYADIVERDIGVAILTIPGGGAAGGLAAGLVAFAGARVESGIESVARAVRLDERLSTADLALTGERSLDRQSAFGKTVAGVARRAQAAAVPCVGIGGRLRDEAEVRRRGTEARDTSKHLPMNHGINMI